MLTAVASPYDLFDDHLRPIRLMTISLCFILYSGSHHNDCVSIERNLRLYLDDPHQESSLQRLLRSIRHERGSTYKRSRVHSQRSDPHM